MSLQPSIEDQEQLADTLERDCSGMSTRERVAEVLVGAGFVATVALLWRAHPPSRFPIAPLLLSLLVFVVATRVRFDTPLGFTVPTQLAFVPLLFATPLAVVPLAVAVGLTIARLPDVLVGDVRPSRLLQAAGNSWFAVGPVVVFAAANLEPDRAGPALLLAALAAQFAVDFGVSTLRVAIADGASLASQLRETWVYGVDASLSGVALLVAKYVDATPFAALTLLPLLGLLAIFARERHQRLAGLVELNTAYRGTALALGDVVEADDGYTGQHCKSVVALAMDVASRMGLGAELRRNLEFGALLHDVGKIAIPKEIINKPGKLEPEEWTIVKTHTLEGQKMLERVGGFMRKVGLIVRSHHERWDGGGYPDGLKGEDIPLEARIIACCDTWNAMRTDRAYRKALSYEVAMAELLRSTGTQLDPSIVEVLVDVVAAEVETSPSPQRRVEAPEGLRVITNGAVRGLSAGLGLAPASAAAFEPVEHASSRVDRALALADQSLTKPN